jgi:hypothetical protein
VLSAQGALPEARHDIIGYSRALAADTAPEPGAPPFLVRWITGNADPLGNLPPPFGRTTYLVWWGTGTWPFWLAGAGSIVWLLACGPRGSGRRLLAVWTLAAWVEVAVPRLFWAHYYLVPLPGQAVAVALALSDAMRRAVRPGPIGPRLRSGVAGLVLLAAIVATVGLQVRDYLLVEPQELTVRFKGGGQWVVLRELGRDLGRRTRDWDEPRLYVWGIQSPLYFYSGLDGVTRQVFADNFIRDFADRDHPQSRPRIERTLRDLEANRPDLVFCGYPPFSGLRRLLDRDYVPTPIDVMGRSIRPSPAGIGLWARRDRLDAFVRAAP